MYTHRITQQLTVSPYIHLTSHSSSIDSLLQETTYTPKDFEIRREALTLRSDDTLSKKLQTAPGYFSFWQKKQNCKPKALPKKHTKIKTDQDNLLHARIYSLLFQFIVNLFQVSSKICHVSLYKIYVMFQLRYHNPLICHVYTVR